MSNNLIEVRNLVKHFEVSKSVFSRNKKIVKAVDGISFDIKAGETLGLVGQSGCGKTTTARSLCLLDPKTSGSVNFYNPDSKLPETPISTKNFMDSVKARAVAFGRYIGADYGEGFTAERCIGVDDITILK